MQVLIRRRRFDIAGTSTIRKTVGAKTIGGSRFAVLEGNGEDDQERMVVGGEVESEHHHVNPGVSIPKATAPTVVPLREKLVANVVSHTPQIHGGTHGAIHIYEQGEDSGVRRTSQGRRGKFSGMLGKLGMVGKALSIRKAVDNRRSATVGVSEIVASMSRELDRFDGLAGDGEDLALMLSDDDLSWMESQFEEDNEIARHAPDRELGVQ
ncbi:hypothetical protein V6N12_028808 [Hibiscus sabdariffa]|uniref:Uncharacterized protein n=1 Tax=Hibiscus sabdariffa TaxID=183260 RepID=A0ABR2F6X2_9ROSI